MKRLPEGQGVIVRIEYYNPYPPQRGHFTFYGVGNSIEEVILELCILKKLNSNCIRDRSIISKLDIVTTGLTDYLIKNYQDEFNYRMKVDQQKTDDFLINDPTKPENSVSEQDKEFSYSVL